MGEYELHFNNDVAAGYAVEEAGEAGLPVTRDGLVVRVTADSFASQMGHVWIGGHPVARTNALTRVLAAGEEIWPTHIRQ